MMETQSTTTEELKLTPEGEVLAASVGEPKEVPQQLTRKQLGQLRRQYYTQVHGTVIACGHKAKFGPSKQPGNNCVSCWTSWFATCVDLMAVHKLLSEQGPKGLVKKFGDKFTKMFRGFLGMYLAEQRKAEDKPVEEPREAVTI